MQIWNALVQLEAVSGSLDRRLEIHRHLDRHRHRFAPARGRLELPTWHALKCRLVQRGADEAYGKLYLGHIVRMQEEIGTGGAGFRYIYAYFLEQAAERLNAPKLQSCSEKMTAIGDEWRTFASLAVRQCRKPKSGGYAEVAAKLREIAAQEEALWREIKRVAADL